MYTKEQLTIGLQLLRAWTKTSLALSLTLNQGMGKVIPLQMGLSLILLVICNDDTDNAISCKWMYLLALLFTSNQDMNKAIHMQMGLIFSFIIDS